MIAENNSLIKLPSAWTWTRLEECVDILDGQRVPINSDEREKRLGGIPYYGATGQVGWIDDYLFDEELVLLGEDGAPFLDPYKHKAYIINGKSWVNNHAHVLRVIKEIVSNPLVCYYLNSFNYRDYISGTTRYKLNQAPMRKIPLPLPPLSEQRRIVAKIEELFTRLDAGVEAMKKIQLQLKRYRQSVLKSAFEGRLTSEWREAHKGELEPASVLLEKIKAGRKKSGKHKELSPLDTADLPELPEGWVWTTMIELTESMKNGIYKPPQFYAEFGVACLRMYNIEDGSIVWKDIKRMKLTQDEIKEYELLEGDILVNRVNSRELVGKAAPIPSGLECCVYESKNIRLRVFAQYVASKYISHWLQLSGQKYFNRNAQQTVGMASINQQQLGAIPLPFCSLIEQQKIGEEIERCFSVADNIERTIEQSLKQAERLCQSILKRAFEGQLVPQDPSDEPAEKLLERIRAEKAKNQTNTKRRRAVNAK